MNSTRTQLSILFVFIISLFSGVAFSVTSQVPLYLTTSATPLMMLTMSRDEQLFKKAYSDYTDMDGDGLLDVTYNDRFDYSGYFDSRFCYSYSSTANQFKAAALATDLNSNGRAHECGSASAGRWSGNFLNWLTMSRIDVLRFVLYGGNRSTDTPTTTVLERAHIPNDLHAWAKVYSGADIANYTPYSGIQSFCNASFGLNDTPKLRRTSGAWTEWAATGTSQCGWSTSSDTPATSDEFVVRVEVCDPVATTLKESFCKTYGTSSKPYGLLQEYGEPKDGKSEGLIRFGLLSGSFSNPRSGGILRRNIGKIANNANVTTPGACTTGDEIDLRDGTFCNQSDGTEGAINAIRRLKLTQWGGSNWSDCNTYGIHNRTGGNGQLNNPGSSTADNRKCSAWGNPISEIYAEALRYIANEGKTASFSNGNDLAGLPVPTWLDPYRGAASGGNPYCASCSLLVLSSGLSSFDSDEIPASNVLSRSAAVATKELGMLEGITPATGTSQVLAGRVVTNQTELAVGQEVNTHEDLCIAQNASDLSLVRGLCPDIPSQEGSYLIAGLAYQARIQDMRPALSKPGGSKVSANTYTVALAENLPKFAIPVPSASGAMASISFTPLCQANNSGTATIASTGWRSCYLGSVTVGPKRSSVTPNFVYGRDLEGDGSAGSFSLVWEDSQWGNDHDNDVVTMITYCVGSKCNASGGTRNGTGTNYDAAYSGYDICWRSNSAVCGTNGTPIVASNEVLIRIETLSAYAGNAMLGGYTVTGSNSDGVKRLLLRPGDSNDSVLTSIANPRDNWDRPQVLKYTAGTSDVKLLQNPLWYAAKFGGFVTKDKTAALNPIAQGTESWNKSLAANGSPDAYFKVTDPTKLKQSLGTVFDDVLARNSSAAAIATNSTRLDTDTLIFQAKFNSADWHGQLVAYRVNGNGTIGSVAWDTDINDPFPSNSDNRKIFSWNETLNLSVGDGVAFSWSSLNSTQQANLGSEDVLQWLRGNQSREADKAGGIYRTRTHLLGDIVNSDPAFVGATNFGYESLAVGTAGQDTYGTYRASTATRLSALYVGANDGMLHAFNANDGTELFAYVPRAIYPNLSSLTNPNYSHSYFVDGAPNFGDAYFSSAWHTVLVGTTGAGGRSVFALDVTNPSSFDATKVLWDISKSTTFPDLGLTIGYATVGRLKNGTWVAIFGNGYASDNGRAVLYIVNVETGAKVAEIIACETDPCATDTANGLSTPALLVDSNRNIIAAYAGDLKGNLWKFNLDGAYEVAYRQSSNPAPLFKTGQPITAPLDIGIHPSGGYLIYFGTGKYYETGDNVVGTNPPTQTFYAVWDDNARISNGKTDFVQQQIVTEATQTVVDQKGTTITSDDESITYNLRVLSANTINWSAKKGWYIDLVSPVTGAAGERVVSAPKLRNGRVIFPTLIPSSAACDAGGTSWLMEVDALTGGRIESAVFDLDGNRLFNAGDYVQVNGVWLPASGMQSQQGIIKTPAITSAGSVEYKFAGGSAGGITSIVEKGDSRAGRQSWRQLR